MTQFRKLLVAIAAMTASLVAFMPTSASAYPACLKTTISIVLSEDSLVGGGRLTIDAVAEAGGQTPPGTITITAFGKTLTAENGSFSKTVKTPVVSAKKTFTIRGTFSSDRPCTGPSTDPALADVKEFDDSAGSETVTLLPKSGVSDGVAGLLPDTGGANIWFLVLGAALVGLGVTVVSRSRRTKKFL